MAQLGLGWKRPATLLVGIPQAGYVKYNNFKYYKVHLAGDDHSAVSIAVTPLYGDPDMYVSLSGDGEPGTAHSDFHSSGMGRDAVIMRPGHPHFCTQCDVYIAVRGAGKWGNKYSIVVTTSGSLTFLRNGIPTRGYADASGYAYFQVYARSSNAGKAEVTVTVSALNGNPWLYIRKKRKGTQFTKNELPTRWRRGHTWPRVGSGQSSITIPSSDRDACVNCDYLIAVYAGSYKNTTFDIVSNVNTATRLVHGTANRVILSRGSYQQLQYVVSLDSSREDLTIRATCPSVEVIMYVAGFDAARTPLCGEGIAPTADNPCTVTPDPAVPATYHMNTYDQADDVVVIPSSQSWDLNRTSFIITVTANTTNTNAAVLTMLATSSVSTVTLLPGVPQQHYLKAGTSMWFMFNLEDAEESLQITTTSISGRVAPVIAVSTTSSRPTCKPSYRPWYIPRCYNYTWMQYYNYRPVVIPASKPCSGHDWMLRTHNCNADRDYKSGAFFITAYARYDTRFTLMGSTVGSHVTLTPGTSQSSITEKGVECSTRNEQGRCNSTVVKTAYVAYFTLTRNIEAGAEGRHVQLVMKPQCSNGAPWCKPTWNNQAYVVYMSSCLSSECSVLDHYPSKYHNSRSETVKAPDDELDLLVSSGTTGYCTPTANDACMYYFTVQSSTSFQFGNNQPTQQFQLVVNNPRLQTLPHVRNTTYQTAEMAMSETSERNGFIAYVPSGKVHTKVVFDVCTGKPALYASCKTQTLPTQSEWDECSGGTSCSARGNAVECQETRGMLSMSVFNEGTTAASYKLTVFSSTAPTLQAPGTLTFDKSSHKLSWGPAKLQQLVGATHKTMDASGASYTVYALSVVPEADVIAPCWLEDNKQHVVTSTTVTSNTHQLTTDGKVKAVVVVVSCDAKCMVTSGAGSTPQQSVSYMLKTVINPSPPPSPEPPSSPPTTLIVLLCLALVVAGVAAVYFRKRTRSLEKTMGMELQATTHKPSPPAGSWYADLDEQQDVQEQGAERITSELSDSYTQL